MENGLLLPAFFFLGGFVASSLTYVVLVVLAPGKPEPRSSRNSRSFVGAIIGLFLYFLLVAGVLVALTAALGDLAGAGKPPVHADAGSAALIGAVVSGLLAWWRSRKEASSRQTADRLGEAVGGFHPEARPRAGRLRGDHRRARLRAGAGGGSVARV